MCCIYNTPFLTVYSCEYIAYPRKASLTGSVTVHDKSRFTCMNWPHSISTYLTLASKLYYNSFQEVRIYSKSKWITLTYNVGCLDRLHALLNSPMLVLNIFQLIIVIDTHSTIICIILSSMHVNLTYLHGLLVPSWKLSWCN